MKPVLCETYRPATLLKSIFRDKGCLQIILCKRPFFRAIFRLWPQPTTNSLCSAAD